MAEEQDPYSILGVLPDAEDVVINAAYRALAQRYHPDKWSGDPQEAHDRMAAINGAYAKVGTPAKRAEYEKTRERDGHAQYSEAENDDFSQAFDSALKEAEDRWNIASSVYEDLNQLRARLHHISSPLAFAFVTVILSTKNFANRTKLAESMEAHFLSRYFGTDPQVVDYARNLIFANQRAAARALNQLVDVLGSEVPAERLISRIETDFKLAAFWKRLAEEATAKRRRENFTQQAVQYKDFLSAQNLCEVLGISVIQVRHGLFKPTEIQVQVAGQPTKTFAKKEHFIKWVLDTLCSGYR